MLEECEAGRPSFPPNVLFNENWLLRIVIDWFETHGGDRYPLSHLPGARWFSEAWLPSAFLPRYRGDRLAESRTHADGVIGHFTIGDPGTAGLTLEADARQLVVVEGKLFNRLSAGVKNAPFYDQAARSVACVAESLRRANRAPDVMDDLSFLVIAPQARVDDGVFAWDASADAIRRKVRRRVEDYGGERDFWFPRVVRADPGADRRALLKLGRRDRGHRLPRPGFGAVHRHLLRQVPPVQPSPGGG